MQETWVQSLGWEDPLEEGMAIHCSILAWRIPWTEEPGGLQSIESQRVRHVSCKSDTCNLARMEESPRTIYPFLYRSWEVTWGHKDFTSAFWLPQFTAEKTEAQRVNFIQSYIVKGQAALEFSVLMWDLQGCSIASITTLSCFFLRVGRGSHLSSLSDPVMEFSINRGNIFITLVEFYVICTKWAQAFSNHKASDSSSGAFGGFLTVLA